jgi:hypothetical protein
LRWASVPEGRRKLVGDPAPSDSRAIADLHADADGADRAVDQPRYVVEVFRICRSYSSEKSPFSRK